MKKDVTVGGVDFAAGTMVTLMIGAADVDEGEFENADRVDFLRERNRHLAFGGGPHRCLGSHLARMELRVALSEWHARGHCWVRRTKVDGEDVALAFRAADNCPEGAIFVEADDGPGEG